MLRGNLADRAEIDAGAAARAVASKVTSGAEDSGGSARIDGNTEDYQWATAHATAARREDVTVYAGTSLATARRAVATVRQAMLIGLPLLLVVVAEVTWLVTRRALRPVEGIRREMAAITASRDLSRRVPEPTSHDEVAALARTTNERLAALEASVERQRTFVVDASHELRSPVASLRTQLEVGAAHPELLDVAGAVEDVVRLQRPATDLLLRPSATGAAGICGSWRTRTPSWWPGRTARTPRRPRRRPGWAASGSSRSTPETRRPFRACAPALILVTGARPCHADSAERPPALDCGQPRPWDCSQKVR